MTAPAVTVSENIDFRHDPADGFGQLFPAKMRVVGWDWSGFQMDFERRLFQRGHPKKWQNFDN
jgi:hypothetical protein